MTAPTTAPEIPTMNEVGNVGAGLIQMVLLAQGLPVDFAGCSMKVNMNADKTKLVNVVLTPIEIKDGFPVLGVPH